MRLIPGIILLICYLGSQTQAAGFWWEKVKAPMLTKSNFMSLIGKDKYVFLEFYSKSCINCENMYPDLNKLYDDIENGSLGRKDIILMRVDGEKWEELSEVLDIEGFPTLVLYKPGDNKYPETYNYDHNYKTMKEYLLSQAPAPKFNKQGSRLLI